jgi:hypothetical protein
MTQTFIPESLEELLQSDQLTKAEKFDHLISWLEYNEPTGDINGLRLLLEGEDLHNLTVWGERQGVKMGFAMTYFCDIIALVEIPSDTKFQDLVTNQSHSFRNILQFSRNLEIPFRTMDWVEQIQCSEEYRWFFRLEG